MANAGTYAVIVVTDVYGQIREHVEDSNDVTEEMFVGVEEVLDEDEGGRSGGV